MAGQLRFEAWTLPTAASFVRKKATIPALPGAEGRVELSGWNDCSMPVSESWSGLSSILSASDSSLIRVYDGSTIIDEFVAERMARSMDRPSVVDVSGPQVAGLTSKIRVLPPDYPTSPSLRPNWIWGGANQLPPLGIGDLQNLNEVWELHTVSDPFALTVDGQATTSLSTPTAVEIEAALQALSTVEDVTVAGTGADADNPWTIIFYVPADPTTFTVSTGTGTITKITEGALDPAPVTQSMYADQRVDPLIHGTYADPAIAVVTTPVNSPSTWALLVNALTRFAGSQVLVAVTPGQVYQVSIAVRPTITSEFGLRIRDPLDDGDENPIAGVNATLTANTWTTMSLEFTAPPGVTTVIMRLAVIDSTPANVGDFYLDWEGALFNEGLAATTPGDIVKTLLEHAQARNVGLWLEPSFDESVDTGSTSWAADLSYQADGFAMRLSDVLADMNDLGIEWFVTPKATPSGAYTHDLNLWVADGAGTDRTTTGPSLHVGGPVTGGSTVARLPSFTSLYGWGAGDLWVASSDTSTSFGLWEDVVDAEQHADTATLTTLLTSTFADEASNRLAAAVQLSGGGRVIPFINFGVGDTLVWQAPPGMLKNNRRVQTILWRHGDPVAEYEVQGSRVFQGVQSVWEAVRRLLDATNKRKRQRPVAASFGGSGGAPTVVVACSDSTDLEKSKADYLLSGIIATDDATLRIAAEQAGFGRLIICSGTALVDASQGPLEINGLLIGMGKFTFLDSQTTNPVAANDGIVLLRGNGATIRDIGVTGIGGANVPAAVQVDDEACTIDNCYLAVTGFGVRITAERECTVVNNWIESEGGVWVADSHSFRVRGNYIEASEVGVDVTGSGSLLGSITDNWIIGGPASIRLTDTLRCIVSHNTLDPGGDGIIADTITDCAIVNNLIYHADEDSITLTDSDRNLIASNRVVFGANTTNTFDIMRLTTSDRNYIHGNHFSVTNPGINEPRYGVNIVSGDRNIVVGNDLGPTADYGTDAINDAGTNTQLSYPSHATYGDNFTS